jgi:hypothetical protein
MRPVWENLSSNSQLNTALQKRRHARNATAPTLNNAEAVGSGIGAKTICVGEYNPDAKVLCVPLGLIAIMSPLYPVPVPHSPAKATPALLTATQL